MSQSSFENTEALLRTHERSHTGARLSGRAGFLLCETPVSPVGWMMQKLNANKYELGGVSVRVGHPGPLSQTLT